MIKEKVLVTGGGGYIGSVACEMLLEAGYEVVVADNFSTGYKEPLELLAKRFGKDRIRYYTVDIRENLADVFDKEKNLVAILHYAAPCSVNESMHDPHRYFSNIVWGTSNLLSLANEAGVKCLVFSSTCAVYGEAQYMPLDEKHPTNPTNPYGQSKLIAEQIIDWYAKTKGLKYVVLRYFNICGANRDSSLGDSKNPSVHLMQNAVRSALDIESFYLTCPKVATKDGTPIRDYIDVVDLAEAHLSALSYLLSGGDNQTLNLGTGKGLSVLEIIKAVEKITGKEIKMGAAVARDGEYAAIVASFKKAAKVLNWKPRRNLEDSVTSLVKWYTMHRKGWGYKIKVEEPAISIIIPTYNSQRHIKKCLQSIKDQNFKNYEVIVVDQSSTDKTADIAKEFKCKVINVTKPNFYSPPSISRNIGARAAKGKILYHLDSDMILEQGLLKEITELITNEQGALIVHESDLTEGFWSKCKAFERKCYWGDDKIESARVVRRDIFKRVGGYDESVSSGEDFSIHSKYKLFTSIGFCKKVIYHNVGELSFWKAVVKKYNYGKTATIYSASHAESGITVLKNELVRFLASYRQFLSSPIYGVGALVLKFCEYFAGGLGFLHNHFLARNKKYVNS